MDGDANNTSFIHNLTPALRELPNDEMLKKHQKIVVEYVMRLGRNGVLVKHDLGTGKSYVAAGVIANAMREKMPTIFLSTKTLSQNMLKTLERVNVSGPNIHYVTMNASNMMKQVREAGSVSWVEDGDSAKIGALAALVASDISLDGKCIVIDEAHNLFNAITNGSGNAVGLYKVIMKSTCKVIFLTGTPIVNHPFELVPCFNMIARREILPVAWNEFNRFFVDDAAHKIKSRDKFMNRISGLVSYYGDLYGEAADLADFPDEKPMEILKIPMSNLQYGQYVLARDREMKEASRGVSVPGALSKPKGLFQSSYRRLSRQLSNCGYPKSAITFGKNVVLKPDGFGDEALKKIDIYSPKWARLLEGVSSDKGKSLIYSSFISNAGLALFARLLELNGWTNAADIEVAGPRRGKGTRSKTFVIISGEIDVEERYDLIDAFNEDDNVDGRAISLIMISSAGAEGVNLIGVRNVHIMEPYWNWMRILQVKGRAIRYKSHIGLPARDRNVRTVIYLSVPAVGSDPIEPATTDLSLYVSSYNGMKLISSFYRALAEAAIECAIFNKNPRIKCRVCVPTNEPLYLNGFLADMKVRSPCSLSSDASVEKIDARTVKLDGVEYAYYESNGAMNVLVKSEELGGYVPLLAGDPRYAAVVASVAR